MKGVIEMINKKNKRGFVAPSSKPDFTIEFIAAICSYIYEKIGGKGSKKGGGKKRR